MQLASLGMVLVLSMPSAAFAKKTAKETVSVRVVYGQKEVGKPPHIDPRLKSLAKELRRLKFTSLSLQSEIALKIAEGSSSRLQLPGGEWMSVSHEGYVAGSKPGSDKLRMSIAVDKLKFKTRVAVKRGHQVVVKGPKFKKGTLILSLQRR